MQLDSNPSLFHLLTERSGQYLESFFVVIREQIIPTEHPMDSQAKQCTELLILVPYWQSLSNFLYFRSNTNLSYWIQWRGTVNK